MAAPTNFVLAACAPDELLRQPRGTVLITPRGTFIIGDDGTAEPFVIRDAARFANLNVADFERNMRASMARVADRLPNNMRPNMPMRVATPGETLLLPRALDFNDALVMVITDRTFNRNYTDLCVHERRGADEQVATYRQQQTPSVLHSGDMNMVIGHANVLVHTIRALGGPAPDLVSIELVGFNLCALIDLVDQNPCMLVQSVDGLVIVPLVLSPAVVRRSAAAVILVGDVDGDRLRLYLPPAPVIANFGTCGVTPTRTAALTAAITAARAAWATAEPAAGPAAGPAADRAAALDDGTGYQLFLDAQLPVDVRRALAVRALGTRAVSFGAGFGPIDRPSADLRAPHVFGPCQSFDMATASHADVDVERIGADVERLVSVVVINGAPSTARSALNSAQMCGNCVVYYVSDAPLEQVSLALGEMIGPCAVVVVMRSTGALLLVRSVPTPGLIGHLVPGADVSEPLAFERVCAWAAGAPALPWPLVQRTTTGATDPHSIDLYLASGPCTLADLEARAAGASMRELLDMGADLTSALTQLSVVASQELLNGVRERLQTLVDARTPAVDMSERAAAAARLNAALADPDVPSGAIIELTAALRAARTSAASHDVSALGALCARIGGFVSLRGTATLAAAGARLAATAQRRAATQARVAAAAAATVDDVVGVYERCAAGALMVQLAPTLGASRQSIDGVLDGDTMAALIEHSARSDLLVPMRGGCLAVPLCAVLLGAPSADWSALSSDADLALVRIKFRALVAARVGADAASPMVTAACIDLLFKLAGDVAAGMTLPADADNTTTLIMRGLLGHVLALCAAGTFGYSLVHRCVGGAHNWTMNAVDMDLAQRLVALLPFAAWPHVPLERALRMNAARLCTAPLAALCTALANDRSERASTTDRLAVYAPVLLELLAGGRPAPGALDAVGVLSRHGRDLVAALGRDDMDGARHAAWRLWLRYGYPGMVLNARILLGDGAPAFRFAHLGDLAPIAPEHAAAARADLRSALLAVLAVPPTDDDMALLNDVVDHRLLGDAASGANPGRRPWSAGGAGAVAALTPAQAAILRARADPLTHVAPSTILDDDARARAARAYLDVMSTTRDAADALAAAQAAVI